MVHLRQIGAWSSLKVKYLWGAFWRDCDLDDQIFNAAGVIMPLISELSQLHIPFVWLSSYQPHG